MNLYDIVKRKDRAVVFQEGVRADDVKIGNTRFRAVVFEPGATLTLHRTDEFTSLQGFPTDLHWTLFAQGQRGGELVVEVQCPPAEAWTAVAKAKVERADGAIADIRRRLGLSSAQTGESLRFLWPPECGNRAGFHMRLRSLADDALVLGVCRPVDPRRRLMPLIRGNGLEVGPGSNPLVMPGPDVTVRYVEAASPEDWEKNYGKKKSPDGTLDTLWKNYIVDSAQILDKIEDQSLDFIFSNHVFEHLPNPIGVLRNWLRKLGPDGVIVGAIPDARYTFDLRQPLSQPAEFLREEQLELYDLQDSQYERWCEFTAPYNTPADLRARGYSIHAHYYSPDIFRLLASSLKPDFSQVFIESGANNKDFGFLLRKA